MIDPKQFITNNPSKSESLKEMDASITCSEAGCFEHISKGLYDSENKKIYWKCSNGHEGSARLAYE